MTVQSGNVVKTVVDFTSPAGNHQQNVWHHQANFISDQSDSAVLAAIVAWVGTVYSQLNGSIRAAWDDPDVACDIVTWVVSKWETTHRVGEGIAGTSFVNTSEGLPLQVSAIATFRTLRPRSRGRKFLPVFAEDTQSGGILVAAAIADVADFVTQALTDITVVASNTLESGIASTVTGTFWRFENGFANDLLHTQRRRIPGVGF